MRSPAGRILLLIAAAVAVFSASVGVGLRLLPQPHTDTDYLVVGSVATFLTLGVIFAVVLSAWIKTPDVFFRKRKKQPGEAGRGNLD